MGLFWLPSVRQGPPLRHFDLGPRTGVILRDFSPEGSGGHRYPRRAQCRSASRETLHGLRAVQGDG